MLRYLPSKLKDVEGYPPKRDRFKCFDLCKWEDTKVVIIGIEPSWKKGYSDGLAFSTYPHVKRLTRQLRVIFQEYQRDLEYPLPRSGNLDKWATRGVLLLNESITCDLEGVPNQSHKHLGWSLLVYQVLSNLSKQRDRNYVFILWGTKAQRYRKIVDETKHLVITAPYPSQLKARSGFIGHKPFTTANSFLEDKGIKPVNWRL